MKQRLLYYNTMIRSVLHYVSSIWTSCDKESLGLAFKLITRRLVLRFLIVYSGFLLRK